MSEPVYYTVVYRLEVRRETLNEWWGPIQELFCLDDDAPIKVVSVAGWDALDRKDEVKKFRKALAEIADSYSSYTSVADLVDIAREALQ